MGSFRSQPDLVKHTVTKSGLGNISYAVSHMCGNSPFTQAGESTWKTRTSTSHLFPIQKTRSLACLTATEVPICLARRLSVHLCGTPLYQRTGGQQKLPEWQILVGPAWNLYAHGHYTSFWVGPKVGGQHPKGNDGKGEWTQVSWGFACWMHC